MDKTWKSMTFDERVDYLIQSEAEKLKILIAHFDEIPMEELGPEVLDAYFKEMRAKRDDEIKLMDAYQRTEDEEINIGSNEKKEHYNKLLNAIKGELEAGIKISGGIIDQSLENKAKLEALYDKREYYLSGDLTFDDFSAADLIEFQTSIKDEPMNSK
ncbi:Uncharacterised protein [uncultured archaeon]|nr:Uncharacterised protein [uncultured archaeon]